MRRFGGLGLDDVDIVDIEERAWLCVGYLQLVFTCSEPVGVILMWG